MFTKKALTDYEKIFHNSVEDPINYNKPKQNWHKKKYLGKKKTIKKQAKQAYPKFVEKNLKFTTTTVEQINEPLIVSYYKEYVLIKKDSKYCSLKNKDKNSYFQRKHSGKRYKKYLYSTNVFSLSHYMKFSKWSNEIDREDFIETIQIRYVYHVTCGLNEIKFTTNTIIDNSYSFNEKTTYSKEKFINMVKDRKLIIYDIFVSNKFKKFNKINDNDNDLIIKILEGIDNNITTKFLNRSDVKKSNPFYKDHPQYESLMKQINKETKIFSGMTKVSSGRTKVSYDINKIISLYNNDKTEDEFNNLELLYTDVKNNYEHWEYTW